MSKPKRTMSNSLPATIASNEAEAAKYPKLPPAQVVKQVRDQFVLITQAHEILCLNEQYARRKVLENGIPECDYFEVYGRYFVSIDFLYRLKATEATQ